MAKGKATPGCPGLECPSHYLMSVSPGRKLRNQGVKTLPAASERAREERDICVASLVTQEPGFAEQEAEAPSSVKGRS